MARNETITAWLTVRQARTAPACVMAKAHPKSQKAKRLITAALYIRASSHASHAETGGSSFKRQIERCRAMAEDRGYTSVQIFKDNKVSGTLLDAKALLLHVISLMITCDQDLTRSRCMQIRLCFGAGCGCRFMFRSFIPDNLLDAARSRIRFKSM